MPKRFHPMLVTGKLPLLLDPMTWMAAGAAATIGGLAWLIARSVADSRFRRLARRIDGARLVKRQDTSGVPFDILVTRGDGEVRIRELHETKHGLERRIGFTIEAAYLLGTGPSFSTSKASALGDLERKLRNQVDVSISPGSKFDSEFIVVSDQPERMADILSPGTRQTLMAESIQPCRLHSDGETVTFEVWVRRSGMERMIRRATEVVSSIAEVDLETFLKFEVLADIKMPRDVPRAEISFRRRRVQLRLRPLEGGLSIFATAESEVTLPAFSWELGGESRIPAAQEWPTHVSSERLGSKLESMGVKQCTYAPKLGLKLYFRSMPAIEQAAEAVSTIERWLSPVLREGAFR